MVKSRKNMREREKRERERERDLTYGIGQRRPQELWEHKFLIRNLIMMAMAAQRERALRTELGMGRWWPMEMEKGNGRWRV